MTKLGLPYQGSKSRIAGWVLGNLPDSDCLVDLFAGGCAVTHAALLSGRFKRVIANDVTDSALFFSDCAHGRADISLEPVDRATFFALKDNDPCVRLCYSFGCGGSSYLYGRDVEPVKLQAQRMLTAPTLRERYECYRRLMRMLATPEGGALLGRPRPATVQLQSLENLQSLDNLQSLGGLRATGGLEAVQGDYRDVIVPEGATVYCDPPYAGVGTYGMPFDHAAFYEWCLSRPYPVYVSEYAMPDGFVCVAETGLQCTMCATSTKPVVEKLFVQERFAPRVPAQTALDI